MADYSSECQIVRNDSDGSCTVSFHCFDTRNTVTVFGDSAARANVESLLRDVHKACLELHGLWSFSLDDSDVARINAAPARCKVDFRTAMLIAAMKAFHDAEPLFDFTVGPVSYLWKHAERVLSDAEVAAALAHVGAEKVAIEGDAVVKADPLVQVDVGGAAKGFAADAVAAHLRLAGITSARIDLGGNLYMLGSHPSGRPWRVAVRVPEGVRAKNPVVEARDKSVVTSGSYERFVEIEGRRYHHIIDATTGKPSASDIVSATVVAASSLQADMLATTVLLAGSSGIESLKSRHPEAGITAFTCDGAVLH